jgi:putative tricarboxylic transport membrane protein
MRLKTAPGEAVLGLAFVGAGAFWIVMALKLPMWDGFAPSSGFLPLLYGVLLIGLSIAALLLEAGGGEAQDATVGTDRRPLLVIAALAAWIAGIEPAGFAASTFLTMLFLFKVAEKLPLLPSLLTAGGSTLALTLIFRTWLGVPLPKGPWGF